ncbi:MAG: hypothetical protein KA214_06275, partial [Neisseriaceae bacterium]|nr:hypothetical protein [Neisseriaceae bacterium]
MINIKLSVSLLACCLALGASNLLFAAPEATPEALKATQEAIEAAQKDIVARQQTQKSIQKSLNENATKIKQQQNEYDRLSKQHQLKWNEAKALQAELNILRVKTQDNRAQLSRMLNAYYKNRYPEAVILLLNNDDPNQKGRNLKYMQYLVDADKKVINELRIQQQRVALQQAEINAEMRKIEALVASKNKVLGQLKNQGEQASRHSQKIDADIQKQTDLIRELRGNERRLNNIITTLAQKKAAQARQNALAEQARKNEAARQAAQAAKLAEAKKNADAKKLSAQTAVEPTGSTVPAAPVVVAPTPPTPPAQPKPD